MSYYLFYDHNRQCVRKHEIHYHNFPILKMLHQDVLINLTLIQQKSTFFLLIHLLIFLLFLICHCYHNLMIKYIFDLTVIKLQLFIINIINIITTITIIIIMIIIIIIIVFNFVCSYSALFHTMLYSISLSLYMYMYMYSLPQIRTPLI